MVYKEYVRTMHLADVLHQLELACYNNRPCPVDKYRSVLCDMLLAVDPDGKQNFLYLEARK